MSEGAGDSSGSGNQYSAALANYHSQDLQNAATSQSLQSAYSQALGALLGAAAQGYAGSQNALLAGYQSLGSFQNVSPSRIYREAGRTDEIARMGFSGYRKPTRRRMIFKD